MLFFETIVNGSDSSFTDRAVEGVVEDKVFYYTLSVIDPCFRRIGN